MSDPNRRFGGWSFFRRNAGKSPSWAAWGSLGLAAFLGVLLYLTVTMWPLMAPSASSDRIWGPQNACLMKALPKSRLGFAVAPAGMSVAAFDGSTVARCDLGQAEPQTLAFPGVSQIAIDGAGTLWLSTEYSEARKTRLWRLPTKAVAPVPVSEEAAALSMWGNTHGVVVLNEVGLLLSFSSEGQFLGQAQVAGTWPTPHQLLGNGDSSLVAVVSRGRIVTFRLPKLEPLAAITPCLIDYVWWTKNPTLVRLECKQEALSYEVNVQNGQMTELAKTSPRQRTFLVPGTEHDVEACEGLPCEGKTP